MKSKKSNFIKVLYAIALFSTLTCIMMLFTGCGKNENEEDVKKYTIQYVVENKNGSSVESIEIENNKVYSLPVQDKAGYKFKGYYDAQEGGVQYVTSKGSSVSAFNDKKSMTLYAQFEPKEYTLYFETNGATLEYGVQNYCVVVFGNSIESVPSVTDDAGEFVGWYIFEGTKEPIQVSSKTSLKVDYLKLKENLIQYSNSNDVITLEAAFKSTINFNANGGNFIENIEGLAGEMLNLPVPVRENYTFAGWYTENGERYLSSKMMKGILSLKAGWYDNSTTIQKTIIANSNGAALQIKAQDVKNKIVIQTGYAIDVSKIPQNIREEGITFDVHLKSWNRYAPPAFLVTETGITEAKIHFYDGASLKDSNVKLLASQNIFNKKIRDKEYKNFIDHNFSFKAETSSDKIYFAIALDFEGNGGYQEAYEWIKDFSVTVYPSSKELIL